MIKHFHTFEDETYLIGRHAGLEFLLIEFEPDGFNIAQNSDHYKYYSVAPLQPLQDVLNKALSQGWSIARFFDVGIIFQRPLQPHADQFVIGKALAITGA